MPSFDLKGCTLLVKKIIIKPTSGSIQKEVPVNPRCPMDDAEKYLLEDEFTFEGVSNPATMSK